MIDFLFENPWFILLTYAIGFLGAAHAIMHIKSPQSAIAWGFTIFFLPFLALPLYILFSHVRFVHFIKDHKKELKTCDLLYQGIWKDLDKKFYQFGINDPDDIVENTMRGTKQFPLIGGHDIHLLKNKETYDAIFKKLERAEDYILLSYFLVRHDEVGQKLRNLLLRKAEEGVRVFFLYDEQGCSNTYKSFWRSFTHEDIHISGFNKIHGPRTLMHYNFRNHRKIIIIDGVYAFTGGLNIGLDYIGKGSEFDHWRDTHIGFSGPAVLALQKTFCRDWYWSTGSILSLNWKFPEITSALSEDSLQIIPAQPKRYRSAALYIYLAAIQSARKRIWITSPYFIPVPELFVALKVAVARGVDVKILLPKNFDHFHTYFAGMTYIHEAVSAGVEVHLYQKGFMHQKTFLIDDELCNIGSLNMDYRSLDLNFEIMALSRSPKLCKTVEKMLKEDLKECIRVKGTYYKKQPVHIRFIAQFIRLFSPVL